MKSTPKNYITPQGAERLQQELRELLQKERPKILETIAWAASLGDRSENADYIYGKRRLREIESRIRFLNRRLNDIEVIDPLKQKGQKVLFGATVTVVNEEGVEKIYGIVGVDEVDSKCPKLQKISWASPIGKSLLQGRVGDVVTVKSPTGETDLEIIKIEYK